MKTKTKTLQLDERAIRRPDWVGGRPIRLMDGQDWLFAPVDFDWEPVISDGGTLELVMVPDLAPELVENLAGLLDAPLDEAAQERYFNVGRFLLQRNYRLTDKQVLELFGLKPKSGAITSRTGVIAAALTEHLSGALMKLSARGIALAEVQWHFPEAVAAWTAAALADDE